MKHEALSFLQTRIGRRFLAILLFLSLLPLLMMRSLAIRKSEAAITEQTSAVLRAAADGAEGQLREFLGHLEENLVQVAGDSRLREALRGMSRLELSSITNGLSPTLRAVAPADVREVFLLNQHGKLVASSMSQVASLDYSGSNFFLRGKEGFFAGDVFKDPETGQPTWIMSAPVNDGPTRRLVGVAAFRIDPRKLSAVTTGRRMLANGASTQSFRLGDTGETYLVNHEGWMITESRYASNAVLNLKLDTIPVRAALDRRQEITDRYSDYRGTVVSGSSAILHDPPWILITEIDFKQAFAPIKRLRHEMIFATVGLILLAVGFAWSTTWRVLNPIRLLSESDHALAERDEARAFVSETGLPNDEIGDLVRMRNSRVRAVFDYQRQLELRTQKLQEMVGELEHISYAIVHDMRAPLRAMQGFASLLETDEGAQTAEERRSYLKKISDAAVRLDHLIQDVLTYNRNVLRNVPRHAVDLGPLLRGVLETYPNLSSQDAIVQVEGAMPVVIGNEALLAQCFSHLLENAIKFSKPHTKPHVHIWSEPVPDSAKFVRTWVEDNGPGIPKQAQSRIFDMFQRLTDSSTGTGIGLAVVRKAVEKMGGRVGVESETGMGSRFWVDLERAGSADPGSP